MINYIYQLTAPRVLSVAYDDVDLRGRAVVKPLYMALCHADQRYYTGSRDQKILRKKLPMALIHECCGEVVSDDTHTFQVGQKVVMIPNVPGRFNDEIFENYGEGSRFLSSGLDGFMREFVAIDPDRLVPFEKVPPAVAAITEFVSVGVHGVNRFEKAAHSQRDTIGVWGDGSLSFVVSNILHKRYPKSKIVVVGKDRNKLALFTFAHQTVLAEDLQADFRVDHAFECCGGAGSFYAIDDIIRCIRPQGAVMLMGVSEDKVAVNTRDLLEKGLVFTGCSRSGRRDFLGAVELMEDKSFQNRMKMIIDEQPPVSSIADIHRVFTVDLNTPFKTVFPWNL